MSEDVIARRARALEALLGPAPEEGAETPDPREAMMVARVGALLGHPGTWPAPPPGLPEALLAEIRRPAARRWWPQLRWTPPRLALGVAGALAALVLAVVMFGGELLGREDGPSRQVAVIQLTGTSAAPDARATMRAIERDAGWRLEVDITGLAPAAPDVYYQGWAVAGPEMVALGTFHMHKPGRIELWSGVPLKTFSRIEVTEQRVGAGQTPGV
ncbi:MAG: anti-sigma factor, partial [Actinoplanes sp.]